MTTSTPLLELRDLHVDFHLRSGVVGALRGLSLQIERGETLGLVGESGSGKSVTALALLRLLPEPPAEVRGGPILFQGEDLLAKSKTAMREIRGNRIGIVFQEPMSALNPVMAAGAQVEEAIRLHLGVGRRAARARTIELFDRVGIPAPSDRVDRFPHELSGGTRQRVMLAMALAADPVLLIADEPTTALDVTVQAQILALLARLRRELGMAMLFITHDLGVVAAVADRVAVMYAGKIVEVAPATTLYARPQHPYTQGLMGSLLRLGAAVDRLPAIPGAVPDPSSFPPGCAFHPRCPLADPRCRSEEPELERAGVGHLAACFHRGPIAFPAPAETPAAGSERGGA